MKKWLLGIVLLGLLLSLNAEKTIRLPKELSEISDLVFINDTTFVSINDSGNEPIIYVQNLNGSIRHKAEISNFKNIDWEDLAFDGKNHVYIGDFGNNENSRKDLRILKVQLDKLVSQSSVEAEAIYFSYPNQTEFPPKLKDKYFDCEAMAFYHDSLRIFTKCRAEPFNGRCYVYSLPTATGTYKARYQQYFIIGDRDWFRDAATAADFAKDKLYILTYNRYIVYTIDGGKLQYQYHQTLLPLTQKESLAIHPKGNIYLADERNKLLGGGNLYVLKPKQKQK